MISADTLNSLSLSLERMLRDGDPTLQELKSQLNEIYASPEYQKWLANDQFYGRQKIKGRFQISNHIAGGAHGRRRLLDKFGLVDNDLLTVKIDKHGGRLHLTDGLWVPSELRVYSFVDESELLCRYADVNALISDVDILIDPACGCGHHGLALDRVRSRISLDVNLRAIAYCRINTVLNQSQAMLLGVNDIAQGLPHVISSYLAGKVLFLVNMPFAIYPKASGRNIAQDGGDRGIELTLAAMSAIDNFRRSNKGAQSIRAVLLAYSLGRSREGPWDIVDRAKKIFEPVDVPCEIKFSLAEGERMWRVNGKKEQPNPMPLTSLKRKAECRFTYAESEQGQIIEGYKALEKDFVEEGFEYLGYGLVDIEVR